MKKTPLILEQRQYKVGNKKPAPSCSIYEKKKTEIWQMRKFVFVITDLQKVHSHRRNIFRLIMWLSYRSVSLLMIMRSLMRSFFKEQIYISIRDQAPGFRPVIFIYNRSPINWTSFKKIYNCNVIIKHLNNF